MTVLTKGNIGFVSNLEATSIGASKSEVQKAIEILDSALLPTTRVEEWKYTRLAKLGKVDFSNKKATISNIEKFLIDKTNCNLVFINGHFSKELSSENIPDGVKFSTLESNNNTISSELNLNGEVFNAINTAYLNDGVSIEIGEGKIINTPIQVIHILSGDKIISNFRSIIHSKKSSEAHIIQGFFTESGDNSFCNNFSEIKVEANAKLVVDKVQYESESSFHISTEQVQQEKDSTFTINTITLNGGLVRNNLNIDVNGQNCYTHLNGAYLLKNKQHVDNHTVVDHKVPNCESHELYKGVMDDSSTGVFNGKVYVREDAQKINAFQSNGNVLLSDNATINSKPELEIYADDVKCSHGSTTGQLDEEAIFYLRTRGMSKNSARQLMVAAFVGDVFDRIENENVKSFVYKVIKERFDWDF